MSRIAIIPARGGSKRIPRKNIKPFLGKPIIAYSIEAAIKSDLFTEIIVSTDDEEIAEISKKYGAQIPFLRSKENASDFATTASVLIEVIDQYRKKRNVHFSDACCIYPTAPFVTSQRLSEGYYILSNKKCDSVFPIVKFGYPIWRALQISTNQKIEMIWKENALKRSQDLPSAYHDAGQWYWFNVNRFLQTESLWSDNSFGLELQELEVQDIDNIIDWRMAELKYKLIADDGI